MLNDNIESNPNTVQDPVYKNVVNKIHEVISEYMKENQSNCPSLHNIEGFDKIDSRHQDIVLHQSLRMAINRNSSKLVAHFLKTPPKDINKKDKNGDTHLHVAVDKDNGNIITHFLDNGASINALNEEKKTPLDCAIEKEKRSSAFFLRNKGGKTFEELQRSTPAVASNASTNEKEVLFDQVAQSTPLTPADGEKTNNGSNGKHEENAATNDNAIPTPPDTDVLNNISEIVGEMAVSSENGKESSRLKSLLQKISKEKIDEKGEQGASLLHQAVGYNLSETVKEFLEKGADVDARDDGGYTPLILASCAERNFHVILIVNMLLEKGADINAFEKYYKTALDYAHVEEVKNLLVQKGAKTYAELFFEKFLRLVKDNNLDALKEMYEGEKDNVAVTDKLISQSRPLLRHAIRTENKELVKYLVTEVKLNASQRDEKGLNAFHSAAVFGNLEIFKILEERAGTDYDQEEKDGYTPLFYALYKNKMDIVNYLLEKENITVNNKKGPNSLHATIGYEDPTIVKKLIDKGADVNQKDKEGQTPLHRAFEGFELSDIAIAKALIDNGADLSATNKNGMTPLHTLAQYIEDNISVEIRNALNEIIGTILLKGGEVDALDNQLKTPLDYANDNVNIKAFSLPEWAFRSGKEVVQNTFLDLIRANDLKAIKDTYENLLSKCGNRDLLTRVMSPEGEDSIHLLHEAAEECSKETIAFFIDEARLDVNKKDFLESTPLHRAIIVERPFAVIQSLIESGADVNAVSGENCSPLDYAARCYEEDDPIIKLLKDKGALYQHHKYAPIPKENQEPEAEDEDFYDLKNTDLHIAIHNRNTDRVKILLDNGADIDEKNGDNKNSIDFCLLLQETYPRDVELEDILNLLLNHQVELRERILGFRNLLAEENMTAEDVATIKKSLSTKIGKGMINESDKDGNTLLHFAAAHCNNSNAIAALLKAEANPILTNKHLYGTSPAETPLHLAIKHRNKGAITALINEKTTINVADGYGYSPLRYLVGSPFTSSFFLTEEQASTAEFMINEGARLNMSEILTRPFFSLQYLFVPFLKDIRDALRNAYNDFPSNLVEFVRDTVCSVEQSYDNFPEPLIETRDKLVAEYHNPSSVVTMAVEAILHPKWTANTFIFDRKDPEMPSK